jgi:hypothetical protein
MLWKDKGVEEEGEREKGRIPCSNANKCRIAITNHSSYAFTSCYEVVFTYRELCCFQEVKRKGLGVTEHSSCSFFISPPLLHLPFTFHLHSHPHPPPSSFFIFFDIHSDEGLGEEDTYVTKRNTRHCLESKLRYYIWDPLLHQSQRRLKLTQLLLARNE